MVVYIISLLLLYLLVIVILLWFPRWVLNLNQDVMWEVPLRGRSVISFRHLGTFLLFHLHFFSFIYLVNFIPHHHLLYLSSYLHICSSPSPFTCHPLYIFVHPQFACQTLKNPKISVSFHGAVRTSRMTWRNPFGYQRTQSAFFGQNDQNAPSQP